jgi:hypothetical protein
MGRNVAERGDRAKVRGKAGAASSGIAEAEMLKK